MILLSLRGKIFFNVEAPSSNFVSLLSRSVASKLALTDRYFNIFWFVERSAHALKEIGPAVVHGGFSTFLAFVCLGASQSYVFSTFFKVSRFLPKITELFMFDVWTVYNLFYFSISSFCPYNVCFSARDLKVNNK